MEYGMWNIVFGIWRIQYMEYGMWNIVYDIWHGRWYVKVSILQAIVCGIPPCLGPSSQNVGSSCVCGLWASR